MSRDSLDTDHLRIREIIAINPLNSDFIQPLHIPSIAEQGQLTWYSSLQFFSTIIIPGTSSTALAILESIQPAISSMSTVQGSTLAYAFVSTSLGLSNIGYPSQQYIDYRINQLANDYGYISTTNLYDIIVNLSNLPWNTSNSGPLSNLGSNLLGGYTEFNSQLVPAVQDILTYSQIINTFTYISSPYIITSSIQTSTIRILTYFTSSLVADTVNIDSIFASTICTYSMVVYGVSTLTNQGTFYTSTLYLPNDENGTYIPISISSGSLNIGGSVLVNNSEELQSTITGLGSIGYYSTKALFAKDLTSTVANLNTLGYLSSIAPLVVSTIKDLASLGYISSVSLQSTVKGLAASGYISSSSVQDTAVSTTQGLGIFSYVSSTSLQSTTVGLTTSGYAPSFTVTLQSTVRGLGDSGYVSSISLQSTIQGLGTNQYVSTSFLVSKVLSTIVGLGQLFYVSSFSLTSTVSGLGEANYISTTSFYSSIGNIANSSYLCSLVCSITSSLIVLGSLGYVSSLSLQSTVQGLGSLGYISSADLQGTTVSTTQGLGADSYVNMTSLISTIQDLSYISTTSLTSTVQGLGASGYISSLSIITPNLTSTTQGLGSLNYISSTQLQSTVQGLGDSTYIFSQLLIQSTLVSTVTGYGSLTYLSSANLVLISTINGLGTSFYISSIQFKSTILGIGTAGYVSSAVSLVSTTAGLGSLGYISSLTLLSTVGGLGINYFSSLTTIAPNIISTVIGLGSSRYISSYSLQSTVKGLGSSKYISTQSLQSTLVSTVNRYGSLTYLSSTDLLLTSTVIGLGSLRYFSSMPSLVSTIAGLGSSKYISSVSLVSTLDGLRYLSAPFIKVSTLITASTLSFVDYQYNTTSNTIYNYNSTLYVNSKTVAQTTTSEVFMIAGGSGTYNMIYSYDGGTSWRPCINALNVAYSITWTGSLWIASGYGNGGESIIYSYNGISWFPTTGNSILNIVNNSQVQWNGKMFVGVSLNNDNVGYSYDGNTWYQAIANGTALSGGSSVIWTGLFWVLCSANGSVYRSYDGITWTATYFIGSGTFYAIAFNGVIFVIGGGTTGASMLQYSYDAVTWTTSTSGTSLFTIQSSCIAWNGTMWVSGGKGTNSLIYSSNGINWTASANGNTIFPPATCTIVTVVWNNKYWYAGGNSVTNTSAAAYSQDGINWTKITGSLGPSAFLTTNITSFGIRRVFPTYVGSNCVSALTPATASTIIQDLANIYSTTSLTNQSGFLLFNNLSTSLQTNTNSTIKGLGSFSYLSTTSLTSTVKSLGSLSYISSKTFISTVAGLGTIGYLSSIISSIVSTTVGFGESSYISSISLQSTVIGLGDLGYISSTSIVSTVKGLGNSGYISSVTTVLTSTMAGLGSLFYISSASLQSTVGGLGTSYVSSQTLDFTLISTFSGADTSYITTTDMHSTVKGLGTASYISSTSLVSTVQGLQRYAYISSLFLQSTVEGLGRRYISTNSGISSIASTIRGFGSSRYFSTFSLNSTVFGLRNAYTVNSISYASTIDGLGKFYISSPNIILTSTTRGLGSLKYVSTASIVSTVIGVSPTGYIYIGQNIYTSPLQIAIGSNAGITQDSNAIAIGFTAGQSNQGCNAIAIGNAAGQSTQSIYTIAIGNKAGCSTQASYATAIGFNAGFFNQSTGSIALGFQAGFSNQADSAIAIGCNIGFSKQSTGSIVIGYSNTTTSGSSPVDYGIIIGGTFSNTPANTPLFTINPTSGNIAIQSGTSLTAMTLVGPNAICIVHGGASITGTLAQGSIFILASENSVSAVTTGVYSINSKNYSYCVCPNMTSTARIGGDYAVNVSGTSFGNSYGAMIGYYTGGNTNTCNVSQLGVLIGYTAAFGNNAGTKTSAGNGAVIIGFQAAFSANISTIYSIAIGCNASYIGGASYSISIGFAARYDSAIYNNSNNQTSNTVSIGQGAGYTNQSTNAIAIGLRAGSNLQGANSIAIGNSAGFTEQSTNSIAIGFQAGSNDQNITALAIGYLAGTFKQSTQAIAVGFQAGFCNQGLNTIAVGYSAGFFKQSTASIAVGFQAGFSNQADSAIAIGTMAAFSTQGSRAIAIGFQAGSTVQGIHSIALGTNAGQRNQGQYTIALGYAAGISSQNASSIILNASGTQVDTGNSGFYVNPVRFLGSNTTSTNNIACYNSTTSELFYTDSLNISSIFTQFGVQSNGNFLTSDSNVKENISSADLSICYDTLKKLPLRRFNYIPSYASSKIDQTQLGFIAQEAYSIFPKSIFSTFDQDLSANILNLNFDQIFMSHYGATQLLLSTVEGYESSIAIIRNIKQQQQSTLQSQGIDLMNLANSYQTLLSKLGSF